MGDPTDISIILSTKTHLNSTLATVSVRIRDTSLLAMESETNTRASPGLLL